MTSYEEELRRRIEEAQAGTGDSLRDPLVLKEDPERADPFQRNSTGWTATVDHLVELSREAARTQTSWKDRLATLRAYLRTDSYEGIRRIPSMENDMPGRPFFEDDQPRKSLLVETPREETIYLENYKINEIPKEKGLRLSHPELMCGTDILLLFKRN